jgi:SAM-dependent methyltransferase
MIKKIYKRLFSEKFRINIKIQFNKLTSFSYLGNQFYCNCCNKSFRKFLPKGNVKRENAQCPYCGSLERTRLLLLYLQNETGLFEKKALKLLHFAPERALFNIFKKLDIEYVDGDINPAYARNTIDITEINYPDNYFDSIICSHVLGHVPDEKKAIKELRRVLKSDGTVLVMTLLNVNIEKTYENSKIIMPKDKLIFYGEPDLCRLHGLDFGDRLQQQGFAVERIDYREKLSKEIVEKYRLGDGQREIIFKCTK